MILKPLGGDYAGAGFIAFHIMRRRFRLLNRRLALVFGGVAGIVAAILAWLVVTDRVAKDTLGFEAAKLLIQFLLVGVLGLILSLLVHDHNRRRDRELLVNDLRRSLLENLIRAYSDTKRARRVIMAHRMAHGTLPYAIYDAQMGKIIDTQLSLELLHHQVTTSHAYFGEECGQIRDDIRKMEKFLGEIIDEYKDVLRGASGYPDRVSLPQLPQLGSMMGKEHEMHRFQPDFVLPYRSAVAKIREQIFL
jgi:hypothetical protein